MGLFNIARKILGGSKEKSGNKNLGLINDTFGGAAGYTGQAGDAVSKFLGGDPSGFNAYKDATGFDFGAEQGSRGITANAAARGLLRSGPTSKALVRFGDDYSQQYARDYIQQYLGLGQLGLGAGSLLSDAGKFSSAYKSDGQLGKFIGGILASDRRLKRDIRRIGTLENGLPWYEFRYLSDSRDVPIRQGLMSDDVRQVRPDAVIVDFNGFDAVHYPMAMAA